MNKAVQPRDLGNAKKPGGDLDDPMAAEPGQRASRLLQITSAIAEAITPLQVLDAVVDQVAAVLEASSTGLWLLDEPQQSAALARSLGYHEAARAALQVLNLNGASPSPIIDVLRYGQPVWISSQAEMLERYPSLASTVTPGRSYRVAGLPLATQTRALGALGLTIEAASEWTEEERSLLLLVAKYASQALERLRLLDAERSSRAQADAAAVRAGLLSAASRAFAEADLDLRSRLTEVVTVLGRHTTSCVGIALMDADGFLHTSAIFHPSPEATDQLLQLTQRPLPLGEGVTGKVAQTGQSALIPTANADEIAARAAPSYRAFLDRFPIYAMMCAPLRARGRIIGTVTATRTRRGETYTQDDLELLQDLADRAASAIENSRLYQENADARERAEQLYRFAHAIVGAEKQEQIFEAALDAIEVVIKTDRTAVLISDSANVMRFRAWRSLSDDYRRAVDGHSPWRSDETAPQPVLISDVELEPSMSQYLPLFRQERIGALGFFPILSRGTLLGKLMVYHATPHRYSKHEVGVAMSIGAHLGSVVARFAATERLREIVHYNELFAGVLAHDLRNPLAAVITAAYLLRMRVGEADEALAKPVAKILGSGQRMSRMIDQLLDVTRARAGGGITILPTAVDLVEVCVQVGGELELANPTWRIRSSHSGNTTGMWDRDRLAQVLSNLLGNAGQHGPPNGAIQLQVDGSAGEAVTVSVHNAGAIEAERLSTLFDPFRGATTRRGQTRGLGLGLFIAREIVRAHGGSIAVESNPSHGTTFTVCLPRNGGSGGSAPNEIR